MVFAFRRRRSSRAISPGLDRLAQTGVVRDEEVHPRQAQGLPERLHLVGVERDPGPERGLKQRRIGGRRAAPPQRVEERREVLRGVEAALRQVLPRLIIEDVAVELVVPEDLKLLPLRVIVRARQPNAGGLAGLRAAYDLLHQPAPRANPHHLPHLWISLRQASWGADLGVGPVHAFDSVDHFRTSVGGRSPGAAGSRTISAPVGSGSSDAQPPTRQSRSRSPQ